MRKEYCEGKVPVKEANKMEFNDGSKVYVCPKAKSVFYATMRKQKIDYTKPRGKATEETVSWFLKSKGVPLPEWLKRETKK